MLGLYMANLKISIDYLKWLVLGYDWSILENNIEGQNRLRSPDITMKQKDGGNYCYLILVLSIFFCLCWVLPANIGHARTAQGFEMSRS